MANVQAFRLTRPHPTRRLSGASLPEARTLIDATDTATEAPTNAAGDVAYVDSAEAEAVCAFVDLAGTVSTLTLGLWTLQDDAWYWHSDYTLDPTKGSQRVDFLILGKYTAFTVQISEIAGGGTAAVSVLGVWT